MHLQHSWPPPHHFVFRQHPHRGLFLLPSFQSPLIPVFEHFSASPPFKRLSNRPIAMFRRHWSGLPKDASFPSDLAGLGFVTLFHPALL